MGSSLRVRVWWARAVCQKVEGKAYSTGVGAEKKDGGNESGLDGGEDEARWQKRDSSDVPGSWPSDASN
jgi:hypothetical protein